MKKSIDLTILTEEDILYCYEEGIRVKLYTRLPTRGTDAARIKENIIKGFYDASENKVMIYLPHITDHADYSKTLFHELAHAIDDLLFDEKYTEEVIEDIAIATYDHNPDLFYFIKGLYKLQDTKFEK